MSEPRPAPQRWSAALIVSLCVNLVLAGVIATAMVRFAWHMPAAAPVEPHAPAGPAGPLDRNQVRQIMSPRVLLTVVPDKADAIRTVLRAHRERVATLRDEAAAARRTVRDLYGAPELDKPALARAIARLQAAETALAGEAVSVALETAPLLSQDERRRVLASSPHDFGMAGGRHHGGHGPDGP